MDDLIKSIKHPSVIASERADRTAVITCIAGALIQTRGIKDIDEAYQLVADVTAFVSEKLDEAD